MDERFRKTDEEMTVVMTHFQTAIDQVCKFRDSPKINQYAKDALQGASTRLRDVRWRTFEANMKKPWPYSRYPKAENDEREEHFKKYGRDPYL